MPTPSTPAAYEWPGTCLYDSIGPEIAHAIGTITINWTYLEGALEQITWQYLDVGTDIAPLITTHLPGNTSSALLLGLAGVREADETVADAVRYVVQAATILRENRNVIVHAVCSPNEGNVVLVTRTARGSVKRRSFPMTANGIAAVGVEIRSFFHYAIVIYEHLRARSENAKPIKLMQKPQPPSKLEAGA